MRLSREEQETIYTYSPEDDEWVVYSSYLPHAKRIIERAKDVNIEYTSDKRIFSAKGVMEFGQVRLYFAKDKNGVKGIHNQTVKTINKRAKDQGLVGGVTKRQLADVLGRFGGGCALTNSKDFQFDHVIPIDVGRCGSVAENLIPLNASLNSSKHANNIFEWFDDNRERFDLSQRKFDELIEYLADINEMTVEEYRDYVYWCHDNPRTVDEIMEEERAKA